MTHKVQIDDVVRDATPDETAEIDAVHAETQAQNEQVAATAKARKSALAKLKELGLTDKEIAALVG